MPRSARLDAPGVLHHVMIRGIERRKIFWTNRDRDEFLERFGTLLTETKTQCFAWVLMPNHAHFLLRSGSTGLPTLMRRLLTGYVVSFNLRHKRHGLLFQNRYKSIICQEDKYFKELVRYIHLNPLRGNIVKDIFELGDFSYCGHGVLLDKMNVSWQNVDYVLGYFGNSKREAKRRYLSYVEAGITQGRRDDLVGGGLIRSLGGWDAVKRAKNRGAQRIKGDERILGDSDFVQSILAKADERLNRKYELKQLGYDLDKIAERVCSIYELDSAYLFSKGRQKKRVAARSLFCYWASRKLGISLTDLARKLDISPTAVGYAVIRGEAIVSKYNFQLIENN
ncbi:MAG: transposase [Desulfobacterales bacterium]|nr:MAG: transposase [Desulfobacterales bacterium]